jgi:hypothetical protein
MNLDQQLADELAKYVADPLGYVMFAFPWDTDASIQMVELVEPYRSRFHCKWGPDKWACEFLDELGRDIAERGFDGSTAVEPIRYSTASGHGIGKSTLVAWLVKFILDTRPFAKGVITANTSEQLRTKTWAEVGKWHKMSITEHLWDYQAGRGSMSLSRKNPKYKGTWRCDGMTARAENSEAFQGLHCANSTPFFIFDEASGIDDKIWEARAGGATDGEPMLFDFGNPTRNSGYFFENCIGKYAHRHKVRHIDSRTVTITNKKLIEEWKNDYGEESDWFKVKVRGMFPSTSSTEFIGREPVLEAMGRQLPADNKAPLLIGVDVARGGSDDTVIYPRIGDDARSWGFKRYNGLNTVQVVGKIIEVVEDFKKLNKPCAGLFVDGGMYGGSVCDQLRALGYNPVEVNFGNTAIDKHYRYRADEMWGKMRDNLGRLCLPNDRDLFSQLTQREGGPMTNGRIHLETKKDMKDRGLPSPDIADALALTYAMTVNYTHDSQVPTSMKSEYDPFQGNW